jgi:hypothetical protein
VNALRKHRSAGQREDRGDQAESGELHTQRCHDIGKRAAIVPDANYETWRDSFNTQSQGAGISAKVPIVLREIPQLSGPASER